MTISPISVLDSELSTITRIASGAEIQSEPLDFSDVLRHVPAQTFYRGDRVQGYFVCIASGLVQARRDLANGGQAAGLGVYGPGEYLFASDCVLVILSKKVVVQVWTRDEFDRAVQRPDGFGICSAFLMKRVGELTERVVAVSAYKVKQRAVAVLLELVKRLGARNANGSYTLPALTHEVLALEIGSTREIVTSCMNAFRNWPNAAAKERALYYDRNHITIFPDRLRKAAGLPEVAEEEHA